MQKDAVNEDQMNELLLLIIFCFWLFGFWFLWKIQVPGDRMEFGSCTRSLSVIIPARNEEQNLGRLLVSLKNQSLAPLEIIVVDDQSEDRTAEMAEKFGCRTIRSADLPDGWAGKPWACMQGSREAQGELFLFLDADTVVERDGLEKLMSSFPGESVVITVQPYHSMRRWWERLSAVFNIIILGGSNAFTPLGKKIKPTGAFGPCLLCSREAYDAVGGHETVRGEILENLALGKIFLDAGFSVFCYGGKGALSFRMYAEGFRSMVEGFSKGFVIGANATSWINLLMIVCWVFGSVSTTRQFIVLAVLGNWESFVWWVGLYLLYGIQFFWMLFRIGNFGVWPALLFPVTVIFFVLVFFLSLFKTAFLKKARWKGRTVSTQGGRRSGP